MASSTNAAGHPVMSCASTCCPIARMSATGPPTSPTVPLVAAGAVAAVAGALVGVQHYRPSAHDHIAPGTDGTSTSASVSVSVSQLPLQVPTSPPTSSTAPPANALGLTHFVVSDLTW